MTIYNVETTLNWC